MLPDIRSLFATVILSVSVLIFGLGAAALLRTAHGNFSNLQSANISHETNVARDQEARTTTLALLRVEMIADQNEHANSPVIVATPEAVHDEHEAVSAETAAGPTIANVAAQSDAVNDGATASQATVPDPVSQPTATASSEPQPAVTASVAPPASDETTLAAKPVEPAPVAQALALAEPAVSLPKQIAKAPSTAMKASSPKAHVVARVKVKPHRIARRRQHVIAQRTAIAAPQAAQQAPFNAPFPGFRTR